MRKGKGDVLVFQSRSPGSLRSKMEYTFSLFEELGNQVHSNPDKQCCRLEKQDLTGEEP